MKNIHVLPTSIKTSDFIQNNRGIHRITENFTQSDLDFIQAKFVNIYITNDEEIKEDEYYIHGNRLHKHLGKKCLDVLTNKEYTQSRLINKDSVFKKVILTTDQDLIKNGVQSIPDEFLEWFVNNSSCEEVEVYKDKRLELEQDFHFYEIIIPKEELLDSNPKDNKQARLVKELANELKQETLEEAALQFARQPLLVTVRNGFIAGAKWNQERSYSEVFEWLSSKDYLSDKVDIIQKEFEQFKKK